MRRLRSDLIGMLMAVACGLLTACGHPSGNSGVAVTKRHAGTPAAPAGAGGPTDLVSAVSTGDADDAPVNLKFQVGARPVAGQPVVITLHLVANQALDHLEARFHPDDGLDVSQGGDFDPEGHMEPGASVDHILTLVPAHDGIYSAQRPKRSAAASSSRSSSELRPRPLLHLQQNPIEG